MKLLCVIISCCFACSAAAQAVFQPPGEAQRLRLAATYTSEPIVLDGRLDEAAWKNAPVAGSFVTCFPSQGNTPDAATEVHVLYDSVNLYIGATCHYHGRLLVQDMRRDFINWDNESLAIMLEPFGQLSMPVTCFCVTPFGTQADMLFYQGGVNDYDWDALWRARCSIGDSVWVAEIAIPFATLRYPGGPGDWRINFARANRVRGEMSGWSPWPIAYDASHMEYAGLLTGVHPPRPKTNIRLEPYALLNGTKPTAGGEAQWAIRTNTTLEATVNTDFAQADVDQQVINLTRSSVFFPEKRQFFKENANLFALGEDAMLQPFFSRQIGLSDSGAALPITGGLRLIHQDAKASAGFLLMHQGGDTADRPAWFEVARYRRNLGNKVQLGAMSVTRYNEGATWNPVEAADAFWRISQTTFTRGMISTGGKGTAGMMEFNHNDDHLFADVAGAYASKNFTAETGYQERSDFIHLQSNIFLYLNPRWLPHTATFFVQQVTGNLYQTASTGQFQEGSLLVSPLGLMFRDLAQVNALITVAWQNLDSVFAPVPDISMGSGKYRYTRYELDGSTNQGAPFSLQAKLSTGGYYNGRLNSWFISFKAAPIPHIAFVLSYTRNDFMRAGFSKGQVSDYLLAPELRLAWNPRILLTGFYQYNTSAGTTDGHLRFSWEYRPLSFVYFVWNSTKTTEASILKVSYIRQL